MNYAIVVATRNRCDMLRSSIPLFLSQSRRPARIVIVDRSDDHDEVKELVAGLAQSTEVPLQLLYGTEPNLALQRNMGLDLVEEDVVMFPDDDTFWFPGTAEEVMKIYEADTEGKIGGVEGWVSGVSPLNQTTAPKNARSSLKSSIVERWRNRAEKILAPHPFNLFGEQATKALGQEIGGKIGNAVMVETMGGWRMTYRTALAKELRFDVILGTRAGYSQHEDKDMSLRVLKAGYLICAAENAPMFHNVAPGKRSNGVTYGFLWLFNYAYICKKVFGDTPPGRRSVRKYLAYKVFLYRLRGGAHEKEIAKGAAMALEEFDALWNSADHLLESQYGVIADRSLLAMK